MPFLLFTADGGIAYYDWYDNRLYYDFFFETKKEADQFYNDLVNDVRGAGIPLTKDNIYGGMSNQKSLSPSLNG